MGDPLLIPKCAGITVGKHFKAHLGDGGIWKPSKRTRRFPLGWFSYKYDPTFREPAAQVRAISGHFIGRSVERLFPQRRIIRSMILREPEGYMLSYYNFRVMRYLLNGQHPYSFSLFMRSIRMNPVAHFLLERWAELPWMQLVRLSEEKKAALLDDMLASFDFVVDIAKADALVASLSAQIGIPDQAPRRNTAEEKQKKTGWKLVRLNDLTQEDRRLLQTRTSLDRYLWRRWAQKENVLFNPNDAKSFAVSELARPGYELQRRVVRRYGYANANASQRNVGIRHA